MNVEDDLFEIEPDHLFEDSVIGKPKMIRNAADI